MSDSSPPFCSRKISTQKMYETRRFNEEKPLQNPPSQFLTARKSQTSDVMKDSTKMNGIVLESVDCLGKGWNIVRFMHILRIFQALQDMLPRAPSSRVQNRNSS